MSSLRISHHRSALGAPAAGGDGSGRTEASGGGAGFALALGAAATAPNGTTLPFGGDTGDGSDGPGPGARKRGDGQAQPGDMACMVAAQDPLAAASLVVPLLPSGAAEDAAGTVSETAGSGTTTSIRAPSLSPGGSQTSGSVGGAPTTTATFGIGADIARQPAAGDATPSNRQQAAASAISPPGDGSSPTMRSGGMAAPTVRGVAAAPDNGGSSATGPRGESTSVVAAPVAAANDPAVAGASAGGSAAPLGSLPTVDGGTAPKAIAAAPAGQVPDPGSIATADAVVAPVSTGPSPSATPSHGVLRPMSASAETALPAPASIAVASGGSGSAGFGGDGNSSFALGERGHFAPVAASPDSAAATSAVASSGTAPEPLTASPGITPTATPDGAVSAAAVSDQVAAHLVRLVSSGSRDMVMRLRPPELGDLTVRVAVNGRDVAAWFASPQPQVQSAISAAIGQLHASLGDAGYNLSGAWVGGDAAGAQQQNAGAPAPARAGGVAAPVSAAPATAAVPRSSTSGLNIYV